ncbi:MAG: JAB domain-containing protein [Kiritimatiellia bacterium]
MAEPLKITDLPSNAIKLGAISIVVAHNHPSGDATPCDLKCFQSSSITR